MMRRLAYILLLSVFSVGQTLAENTDSINCVQTADHAANDTVQADSSDFIQSSILFMSRDKNRLATYFGHIALRLNCPSADLDFVFTFSSRDDKTILDIVLGNDLVALVPAKVNDFLKVYDNEGRDVYEYRLNLTLNENRELWKLVDKYVKKGLYLPNDYFNRGCAQETASLVLAIVKGHIEYGDYINEVGSTYSAIVRRELDEGSWLLLLPYMIAGSDRNRHLDNEERLIMPTDMIEAWKQAKIVDDNGTKRSMFKSNTPTIYRSTKSAAPSSNAPSTIVVFGIVLAVVVIVTILQFATRKADGVAKAVDAVLLTCVSLFAAIMLVIHLASRLPIAQGWTHSYIEFNLIPLIIYLVSLKHKFSGKTWMYIYATYTVALVVLSIWMLMNMEQIDAVEFLIIGTLALRCIARTILNKTKIIS